MAKKAKKGKGLFKEFKEFINKGNAFMLAVGVVIGGAFGAIVTAFVNILLSVATWAVHAEIGLGQKFSTAQLHELAKAFAEKTYTAEVVEANPNLIESVKGTILSKYTLHGTVYTYNMSAVIDWGALLTAIISFLIIALVLFIIVKVVSVAAAKKAALEAKAQEEYYNKHPEERPVPAEPGAPEPTEVELLKEIRDALVKKEAK